MSLSPSKSNHNQHDDTILSTETLDALKPYIHALVTLTRLLRWKPYNNDKTSPTSTMILLMAAWSTLFYHHQLVLSLVAPIFIIYLATAQSTTANTTTTTATTTTATTAPTVDQRRHVNNDNDDHVFVNELIELVQLLPTTTHPFKLYSKKQDNRMIVMLVYLVWLYVLYSERLGLVVWMIGCMCFMWCSPWITQLRNIIYARQQAAIAASSSQTMSITTSSSQEHPRKPELDRLYCFCIYQHQRWWLHTGWSSSLMLPQDRPVWSDEYLEPTPSVDEFSLPPPIGDQCWVWTDPAWKVDNSLENSSTGWEYGSWDWDAWSIKPSFKTFTRRKKWIRCARLVTPPSRSSNHQLIQHDNTTTSDTQSDCSTCSNSTTSTTLISASPPSLSFSPKPRPSSLLTHRTLSSVSTILTQC